MFKTKLIILSLIILLLSCQEERFQRDYPLVITNAITDVSEEGATFHGELSGSNIETVIEHGFVWGTDEQLSIESSISVSLGKPKGRMFNSEVRATLKNNIRYFVRAYIKTVRGFVYGRIEAFNSRGSAGPVILDFYPKKAMNGDTLTLIGRNFYNNGNEIGFEYDGGIISTKPFHEGDTILKVIIPHNLFSRRSYIVVSSLSKSDRSIEEFHLAVPGILSINSDTYKYCDTLVINWESNGYVLSTIEINGELYYPGTAKVYSSTINASLKSISDTLVLRITSGSYFDKVNFLVSPIYPKVISAFPVSVSQSDTIFVEFDYLPSCTPLNAIIYVSEDNAYPLIEIEREGNTIKYFNTSNYYFLPSPFRITFFIESENNTLFLSPYIIKDSPAWTKIGDFLGSPRINSASFEIGDRGYVVSGQGPSGPLKDFWEYDPESNKWMQKADFPGNTGGIAAISTVDGKAYVVLVNDSENFWEFNPSTNIWTKKADYPGSSPFRHLVSFSINGKVYFGGGSNYINYYMRYKDFWEYCPATDVWSRKSDLPSGNYYQPVSFSFDSKGYYYLTDNGLRQSYVYDPSKDEWILNLPINIFSNQINWSWLVFNDFIYLTSEGNTEQEHKTYRLDPKINKWILVGYPPSPNHLGGFGFVIKQKGYYGLGVTGGIYSKYNHEVFEFDPSKL